MSETAATPHSTEADLIAVRREKLGKLRELGVDPFGAAFETTHTPAGLRDAFAEGLAVKVAGRINGWRDMGKSCFFHVGDVHGQVQGYISIKDLPEDQLAVFKCLERGDWLGIEGETFLTRTGEPTVKVSKFTVLSKSLRPMPDK
jgi:lysyl-tRNA synthetase class 2